MRSYGQSSLSYSANAAILERHFPVKSTDAKVIPPRPTPRDRQRSGAAEGGVRIGFRKRRTNMAIDGVMGSCHTASMSRHDFQRFYLNRLGYLVELAR
jgi:hypothetical protein